MLDAFDVSYNGGSWMEDSFFSRLWDDQKTNSNVK